MQISKLLIFLIGWYSSASLAISTEERLNQLIAEKRWEAVVSESHDWLKTDALAVVPKIKGAEALVHLGLPYSANFYLKKLSGADFKRAGNPRLQETFYQVFAELTQSVPWNQLVEIPTELKSAKLLSPSILFSLGFEAFSRKQYGVALDYFSKIGDSGKAGKSWKENIARYQAAIFVRQKQYAKASALLAPFEATRSHLAQARLWYVQKKYDQALGAYNNVTPPPADELAWTLVAKDKGQEALDSLRNAEGYESELLKAELALKLGKRDLARTAADRSEKALAKILEREEPEKILSPFEEKFSSEMTFLQSRAAAPSFAFLREQLEPVGIKVAQSLRVEQAAQFKKDRIRFERDWVKSKMLLAETLIPDDKNSSDYPSAVAKAAELVEQVSEVTRGSYPELEMKKAELLWKVKPNENSVRVADRVYRNFPNYPGKIHAVFFLGNAHLALGREAEAQSFLEQFVHLAPKDRRVPDTYRVLGDIHFDKGRYSQAETTYKKVLGYPQSKAVGYAHYKLGWTQYHQRRFPAALAALEEAVVWSDRWEKNESLLQLEREARRDLISIYAETGEARKAPLYFEKFLRSESKSWIVELAAQLESQGQYEKATELYRYLVRKDPNSNDNLAYLSAIIRGQSRLRNWKETLSASQEMTIAFGPMLQGRPSQTATDPLTTPQKVEADFREAVLALHQEQNQSRDRGLDTTLLELTVIYLRTFRNWEQTESVLLTQAETLSRLKQWKEASSYYREYLKRFGQSASTEAKERAYRGAIAALDARQPGGKVLRIASLNSDPDYEEMIILAEDYLKMFPGNPAARSIAYTKAFSLLVHGEVEKGLIACQKIFDFHPLDEPGKQCFNNVRTALYLGQDWRFIYDWATEVYARKFPGIDVYHPELTTIRSESLMKWAETEKNDGTAATIYLSATNHRELRGIWEKALYNSFIRFNQATQSINALKVAERLETEYPKSSYLIPLSIVRASIYQEAGDYEKAYPQLVYYLRKASPGAAAEAPDYAVGMLNAGALAISLGKRSEAESWLENYEKNPGATLSGKSLAQNLKATLSGRERGLASVPKERWNQFVLDKENFERTPVPAQGTLPSRIKTSVARLEVLARGFLDFSAQQTFEGNESLCALATLYSSLEKSLRDTALTAGENSPQILKLAVPLTGKAKEFATDCLQRAAEAEHDGPFFRQANSRWGWEWDPILAQRVNNLVKDLSVHYPQFDPITINRDEAGILEMHLQKVPSAESWYTLVRLRCQKGPSALCRMTLTDASTKFPTSGKLLNATAILYGKENRELPSSLLARALEQGSTAALPNLAFYHLKEGRVSPGLNALRRSYAAEVFERYEELNETIKPWMER